LTEAEEEASDWC